METSKYRARSIRILLVDHGRALLHGRMYYQNKTLRRTTQPLSPMEIQPGRAAVRYILFSHGFHASHGTPQNIALSCAYANTKNQFQRIQHCRWTGDFASTPAVYPQSTFRANADYHISRRTEECLGDTWSARKLACVRFSNLPFLDDSFSHLLLKPSQ